MKATVRRLGPGGRRSGAWVAKVEVIEPQTNRGEPLITLEEVARLQKAGWAQRYVGEFLWWNEPGTKNPRQYEDAIRVLDAADARKAS